MTTATPIWKLRITGYGEASPADLHAHPSNARRHPQAQRDALNGLLSSVGIVQNVVVSKRSGYLLDGHARVEEALATGQPSVPVTYVDLSADEEALVLAAFDTITGLAEFDAAAYGALLRQIETDSPALQAMLAQQAKELGVYADKLNTASDPGTSSPSLSDRFVVPPFSVLDARQGYWQERKRAWLALGIQSELGRGGAEPGGSPRDAASLGSDGHTQRGDGTGRPLTAGPSRREADQRSNVTGAPGRPDWATGTGTENMAPGTSIFDPVLCELAYRWFSPRGGAVLDPFAGGSVRGIVAAKLGRAYTGIDLRPEQIAANEEQAGAITPDNPPHWIAGDSRDLAKLVSVPCDLLFSCPPYADLERYSDDPRDLSTLDYADFLASYRDIIAQAIALLRHDRFACFVVGDVRDSKGFYRNFIADTIAAFQDAGARLYNDAVLVTAVGSLPIRVGKQFTSARKLGKTHQNVLVFVKGDPRKATDACGPVDVELPEDMLANV